MHNAELNLSPKVKNMKLMLHWHKILLLFVFVTVISLESCSRRTGIFILPAPETLPDTAKAAPPDAPLEANGASQLDAIYLELAPQSEEAEDVSFLTDITLAKPVEDPSQTVPIESNDRVDYFLKTFRGPQKRWMLRALKRSGRYTSRMKEIFVEEGLPDELVYLAIIESGFNPYAFSRAGAMGIWQFMPATGKRYGLVINWWIDERRDLEKSTRAAARYLKDLYALFDDWYLAAAAYNAGEGKISRGLRKYESNNFWHLSKRRYLKKETKDYVPRFLAALMIAKEPDRYGFGDIQYDTPLFYETVAVSDATDLAVVAQGCGYKLRYLNKLNPQLRRGCTPSGYKGDYDVKVPLGTKERFITYYEQLDPNKRLTFRRHRIKGGDTLSHLAERYGVSVRSIMQMNRLKSRHSIREGKNLIIPIPARYAAKGSRGETQRVARRKASKPKLPNYSAEGFHKITHVVKKGDSLWTIGTKYGVTSYSLKKWNGLRSTRIHPGKELVVWKMGHVAKRKAASKAKTKTEPRQASSKAPGPGFNKIIHVVKNGESLWTISSKYGVTSYSLKKWNSLRSTRLHPGNELIVWKKDNVARTKVASRTTGKTESRQARSKAPGPGFDKIIHVVKNGESLWTISSKYGVSSSSLKQWNRLSSTRIYPGQKVVVWKEDTSLKKVSEARISMVTAEEQEESLPEIRYVVQPGDTLWEIAQRFRVTIAQLAKMNNLDTSRPIRPGLKIRIPKKMGLNASAADIYSGVVPD